MSAQTPSGVFIIPLLPFLPLPPHIVPVDSRGRSLGLASIRKVMFFHYQKPDDPSRFPQSDYSCRVEMGPASCRNYKNYYKTYNPVSTRSANVFLGDNFKWPIIYQVFGLPRLNNG